MIFISLILFAIIFAILRILDIESFDDIKRIISDLFYKREQNCWSSLFQVMFL